MQPRAADDTEGTSAVLPRAIEDINDAVEWLKKNLDVEPVERAKLLEIALLLQKPTSRGDREKWHKALTNWFVPRRYKPNQDGT